MVTCTVRVCVDMRRPNEAIKHDCHSTPTLSEMSTMLNGAVKFSLNWTLDKESVQTTNFGVDTSAEIFQAAIHQTLNPLNVQST